MLGSSCRKAVLALVLAGVAPLARAYIPALPISDPAALNLSDSSTIQIAWQNPLGFYSGFVYVSIVCGLRETVAGGGGGAKR